MPGTLLAPAGGSSGYSRPCRPFLLVASFTSLLLARWCAWRLAGPRTFEFLSAAAYRRRGGAADNGQSDLAGRMSAIASRRGLPPPASGCFDVVAQVDRLFFR